MAEIKKLSIIIVAYNSTGYLERCVASIYDKLGDRFSWEIIIVNNDISHDIASLCLDFSKIRLIDHRKNVGFGAGMNKGARVAQGEVLLILNPDTEFVSGDIDDIMNELDKEIVGVIGGETIDCNHKKLEWNAGHEVSLYDLFRNNLGLSRSKKIWNNPTSIECEWTAGTAFFIKKKLFWEIGGFDEDFFMYFEDMDLCRRVRKAGKKIMFFPEFKIFHGNGKSYSSKSLQKKHYYDSMEKYFRKNRNLFSWMIVKVARNVMELTKKV